jgi:hypothetical protein
VLQRQPRDGRLRLRKFLPQRLRGGGEELGRGERGVGGGRGVRVVVVVVVVVVAVVVGRRGGVRWQAVGQ